MQPSPVQKINRKKSACKFCTQTGHNIATCQERKSYQFKYVELVSRKDKMNLVENIQSTPLLKCYSNDVQSNPIPLINVLTSKQRNSHFILNDVYVKSQELTTKQSKDMCHDIIADVSFLSNGAIVPHDQKNMIISGEALLCLISHTALDDKQYIYDGRRANTITQESSSSNWSTIADIDKEMKSITANTHAISNTKNEGRSDEI